MESRSWSLHSLLLFPPQYPFITSSSLFPRKMLLLCSIDGSITTTFDETVPTSTYLLAFIVSDFQFLINENDGMVPHRTLARPNAIHLTEYALQIGVEMLDILAEFIGIAYSLPKMDQAGIPDFAAGAMENWGLVTYRFTIEFTAWISVVKEKCFLLSIGSQHFSTI